MIDQLKTFRGEGYSINDKITVRQPTLGDITDYGEQRYLSLVRSVCSTPAERKVEIWDKLNVFWEKVDEYTLFLSVFPTIQKMDTSILFGDLDISSFELIKDPKISDFVLVNKDRVVLDRAIHKLLTDYLRLLHRIKKNVDVGYDDNTRKIMIEDDRDEMRLQMQKPFCSFLQPLISSLTNCPEFKYRWDDVWMLPIGVFMDSVERIQKHKNFNFTMQGVYAGTIDAKKLNKNELRWMGDLK